MPRVYIFDTIKYIGLTIVFFFITIITIFRIGHIFRLIVFGNVMLLRCLILLIDLRPIRRYLFLITLGKYKCIQN